MSWADHGKRPGPKPKRPKGRQPCIFDGCNEPNYGHGLCRSHWMQQRRGVELRPIRPPRPEAGPGLRWCGKCKQFVDEDDFGWDKTRNQPRRECRPCHATAARKYNTANREQVNLVRRTRKRGLTVEQYDAMEAEQAGRCAVCERERPLDIDHCHKTGQVRALLCGPCNRALGFLDDDPDIAAKAVEFLRRHG